MDDLLGVEIFQSFKDLEHKELDFLFGEPAFFLDQIIEGLVRAVAVLCWCRVRVRYRR